MNGPLREPALVKLLAMWSQAIQQYIEDLRKLRKAEWDEDPALFSSGAACETAPALDLLHHVTNGNAFAVSITSGLSNDSRVVTFHVVGPKNSYGRLANEHLTEKA